LSKIPKEKKVYCDDFDVGTFISPLLCQAQTEIDSSVTSILNSLTPLNTLVLSAWFWRWFCEDSLGCLMDFWEAYLVFLIRVNHPIKLYYAILVIIASICYAVNVSLIKSLSDLSPVSITTDNF
jgi:drug/metabolite transporter (DMT)-like permease